MLQNKSIKLVFLSIVVVMRLCVFSKGKVHILAPADEAGKWAEERLAGLTLEKKIGQMICTDIAGGYIAEGDPRLRQWVELLASG
ncbi:MAG: hypothetical protein OEY18_02600 [Candidatus Aminicenantes bacterium]|nr:hypothetical protein [Candidatus Aminicenantes bacterium]MDH5383573.1 hypothetical protein [Candidatus Aminicenantes bacterium]MDH5742579.1 hypothetical protein [Candidatus Aminicenantes bacterium]